MKNRGFSYLVSSLEEAEIIQSAPAKKSQTKFLIVCVCLVLVIVMVSVTLLLALWENQSLRNEKRTLENNLAISESSYASLRGSFSDSSWTTLTERSRFQ